MRTKGMGVSPVYFDEDNHKALQQEDSSASQFGLPSHGIFRQGSLLNESH
jgi:hypothetical protein